MKPTLHLRVRTPVAVDSVFFLSGQPGFYSSNAGLTLALGHRQLLSSRAATLLELRNVYFRIDGLGFVRCFSIVKKKKKRK